MRRADKPTIVIANKAEGSWRDGLHEAFSLGLGDPIAFSAEHGEGLGELYDALAEILPAAARIDPDEEDKAEPLVLGEEEDGSELDARKPLRIAVLGRPNSGKSTSSIASSAKTGSSPAPSPASPGTASGSRRNGAGGS